MEQKRLFKTIGIILLVIEIGNALLFFTEMNKPISNSQAAHQMLRTSMMAHLVISFLIIGFFAFLLFRALHFAHQESQVQTLDQKEQEIKSEQELETEKILKEEEYRKKEETRVKQKIEAILEELDNEREIESFGKKLLRNISKQESIAQGMFYMKYHDVKKFRLKSTFALYGDDYVSEFEEGEGISGQVATNRELLMIDDIPEDYIKVYSGLGSSSPRNLLIVPIVKNGETLALMELASFEDFDPHHKEIYNAVAHRAADTLERIMSYVKA